MAKKSLKDFLAENPPYRTARCWVCLRPERQEIDEAFRGGASPAQVLKWLIIECGYGRHEATLPRVHYHKQRGHHESS